MPTLFASSEKNVQWIKVVTNDSIGTCSSELYSFNLLKLPAPPRAAILVSMLVCSGDTNTNCTQKQQSSIYNQTYPYLGFEKPSKKYQQPTNPTCFSWKIPWAPHAGWDGAEFSCIQGFLRPKQTRPGCECWNKQSQLTNPTSLARKKTVGMGRDSCSFLEIAQQTGWEDWNDTCSCFYLACTILNDFHILHR